MLLLLECGRNDETVVFDPGVDDSFVQVVDILVRRWCDGPGSELPKNTVTQPDAIKERDRKFDTEGAPWQD